MTTERYIFIIIELILSLIFIMSWKSITILLNIEYTIINFIIFGFPILTLTIIFISLFSSEGISILFNT